MRRRPRKREHQKRVQEVVNPLDLMMAEEKQEDPGRLAVPSGQPAARGQGQSGAQRGPFPVVPPRKGCAFFITGTDTGVGKTITTFILGMLFKEQGWNVGVMKPIQCGGEDTKSLMQSLNIPDDIKDVNPYFFRDAVSPHLAFQHQNLAFDAQKVKAAFEKLQTAHDIVLVEGAGGLLVPITEHYLMADLIRDLDLDIILVARPGLGTLNHTLLSIFQARDYGLKVKGVILNQGQPGAWGLPEKTNPQAIQQIGRVPVLGVIPYFEEDDPARILIKCRQIINLPLLFRPPQSSSRTQELRAMDKKCIWHPFTQMKDWEAQEPLVIHEAKGSYLIDTDGNKYLDGISSLWVNVHGHRKKEIDRAIRKQINRVSHTTLLGLSNTPAVELAGKLVEIAPHGLEKVFYSDNGSTAVEVAIKMAYQYWQNTGRRQKTGIAHLSNSYHGDTLGSVSVGGIDLFHRVYERIIFRTIKIDFPDCYRSPEGKEYPSYAFECLERMENIFKRSPQHIAALVVEPIVQAAAGMIIWPEGILKRIRELCDKYEVFLIADEVATGFGRTGKMFACEHEDVIPDFLCLAKGMTGGYLPLAATLTTRRVYDGFLRDYQEKKTFFHGHTYTGNPLACAAAIANLEIFEKERVLERLQPKMAYLEEKLKYFLQLPHVGDVRRKGMMIGIELVRDKKAKAPYPWEEKIGIRVCEEARKNGVLLRPLGNVIVLMPPLSIASKELHYLLQATYQAVRTVTSGEPARLVNPRRK